MNLSNKAKINLVKSTLFAILVLLISNIFYVYSDIDNYYISLVVNQFYSTNNNCLHVSPILCKIILLIRLIISQVDCYIIFTYIAVYISLFLIFLIIETFFSKSAKYISFFLILSFCSVDIFHANFTIITSLCISTGLLSIRVLPNIPLSYCKLVKHLSYICIICGCLLRKDLIILSIPFILISIYFSYKNNINFSTYIKNCLLIAFVYIISLTSWYFINYSSPNKSATEYSIARSAVNDYPYQQWSSTPSTFKELYTESEYQLVHNLFLIDTQRIDYDYLSTIDKIDNPPINLTYLSKNIYSFVKMITQSNYYLSFIIPSVFVLMLLLVLNHKLERKEILCNLILCIVINIYFIIKGRCLERVSISIYMFSIISLIYNYINIYYFIEDSISNNHILNTIYKVFITTKLYIPIIIVLYFSQIISIALNSDLLFTSTTNSPNIQLSPNNTYIWNPFIYDEYIMNKYGHNGKFPDKNFISHNIPYGEWTYSQLYYTDYFNSVLSPNPIDQLIKNNTYYLITSESDCDLIASYCSNYYAQTAYLNISSDAQYEVWNLYIEN